MGQIEPKFMTDADLKEIAKHMEARDQAAMIGEEKRIEILRALADDVPGLVGELARLRAILKDTDPKSFVVARIRQVVLVARKNINRCRSMAHSGRARFRGDLNLCAQCLIQGFSGLEVAAEILGMKDL